MKFFKTSVSRLKEENESLRRQVESLELELEMSKQDTSLYLDVIAWKNKDIFKIKDMADEVVRRADTITAVLLQTSQELLRTKTFLKEGTKRVKSLIDRIDYESAQNQNYLRNLIEGDEVNEITAAENWLEDITGRNLQ